MTANRQKDKSKEILIKKKQDNLFFSLAQELKLMNEQKVRGPI